MLCYHTVDKFGDDFGFALLIMSNGIAQQAVHQTVGSDAYDTYAGSLGSALTTAALVDTYSGIEQSYAPTLAPTRIVHSGTQDMCAESNIGASFISRLTLSHALAGSVSGWLAFPTSPRLNRCSTLRAVL